MAETEQGVTPTPTIPFTRAWRKQTGSDRHIDTLFCVVCVLFIVGIAYFKGLWMAIAVAIFIPLYIKFDQRVERKAQRKWEEQQERHRATCDRCRRGETPWSR